MPQRWFWTPLVSLMLVGAIVAVGGTPSATAQDATPTVEGITPEGVDFAPVAYVPGLALPSSGELEVVRYTFAPGAGFAIAAGDPTYSLAIIERGELTVALQGPLVVTRAGAIEAALEAAGATGTLAPETETTTAGQPVVLQAGDAALFPPDVAGHIGNDSQEPVVAFVVLLGPTMGTGTPAAGTPAP